jgi:hypothetical protein
MSSGSSWTVRRLEEAGIAKTPLQQEWDAITSADSSEQQFCLVAAALGLDPYEVDDEQGERVLGLGEFVTDSSLALGIASSVSLDALPMAQKWVAEALGSVREAHPPPFELAADPLPLGERVRPWELGYDRARHVRAELSADADEALDVSRLVGLVSRV